MDREKFTATATGTLVSIRTPSGKDWAFVPRPIPPDWQFPNELWPLLAEAREALGTLNGIGQTLPDPQLLLRPLQSREALASSRIEGTFVAPAQLLLYELDAKDDRPSDNPDVNDWREVINYNRALSHGWDQLQELPLINRVIKEMHGILLRGVRGSDKRLGEFRQLQVQIGSKGRFVPPPPSYVEFLMTNLEQFINDRSNSVYDPLVRSYIAHYQFETIHPFADGNGRVGRALLALMIYKELRHAMPWLYMSPFYDKYNDEYVEALFNISARGDWTQWITYCLNGTIAQATDAIMRCRLFKSAKEKFHGLVTGSSSTKRTHQLIDHLFGSPVITVPSLQERFGVAYKTAKKDIECLIEAGILHELADEYPRSFFCPELMKIAYDDANELLESDTPP